MVQRLEINDLPAQEALKVFVPEFIADRQQELTDLYHELKSSNFEHIRAIAHQWKGFSDPYGFQTLSQYAVILEQEAIKKNDENIKNLLTNIKDYLVHKEEQLDDDN